MRVAASNSRMRRPFAVSFAALACPTATESAEVGITTRGGFPNGELTSAPPTRSARTGKAFKTPVCQNERRSMTR